MEHVSLGPFTYGEPDILKNIVDIDDFPLGGAWCSSNTLLGASL
jgi:hypothetical protein